MNLNKKTSRKSEYLRKIDVIGKHLNVYSLKFKNQEFESDWRLNEISIRKYIYMIMLGQQTMTDVFYSLVVHSPPVVSSIIRFGTILFMAFAFFQIYYKKEAKEFRQMIEDQGNDQVTN